MVDFVSLDSPFDEQTDAFASTVAPSVINNVTPLSSVETTPTQKSLIPKDMTYSPDFIGRVDTRITPMIWDASRKMNVPNPAYVAPDFSGIELLNSFGPDYDWTSSNLLEVTNQIQQQETEKYGLIPQLENFNPLDPDTAAQKIYLDEANKMIKDFGVEKEDAEQWYSDILEFTEDRPVYGLDVSPELSGLAGQRTQLQDEGYVNKTNAWINELEGLDQQDPSSFTSSFNEMPTINKLQYLYSAYEKGNLTKDQYKENFKNTVNANYDPQLNPNTKVIIDIKGNDYLVDADSVYGQMTDPFFLKSGAFYADDSLYFPSEEMSEGAWLQSIGSGQKSAEKKIEDLLEPSTAGFFLNNPVTQIAGLVIPGFSAATTLAKVATGEKVSPMEIASGLLTGLEMAGVVKPPIAGSSVTPKGGVGPVLPSGGTGLFGSTYAQTQTALNVAAAGDAKGAAIALVGDNLIKGGLDKIGLDQEAIENAGIQYDDFQAGIGKTVQKLAEGEELDEALAHGLGKYIREGGTLGSIDLPSVDLGIDLGGIEKLVKDLVRPIGAIATDIAHFVEDGAQKIGDATRPIIKAIEKPLKPVGDFIEDVGQFTGDVVEDVGQAVGDVASDLDTAVRQALPNTSIDLPSVDLPSVNLPNLGLNPSLGSTGMLELKYPSATRTTDALFGDELFKFKNKIESTQERLEYIDLNEPVENFFEDTINERQPRSYMF